MISDRAAEVPRWRGWAPVIVLPAAVLALTPAAWPRWAFMWMLAAAIYAGWRDMDDYMRENKIEPVPPKLDPDGKPRADADADADPGDGSDAASDKPDGAGEADKSGKKDRARTERPAAKDEKPGKAADKGASASSS